MAHTQPGLPFDDSGENGGEENRPEKGTAPDEPVKASADALIDASGEALRVFLGRDGMPLESAAEWILEELGTELGDVIVALPGARAARRLRELLARSAPPNWTPPKVLTQGELSDALIEQDRPVASRLARTLAWERALSRLEEDQLERLAGPAERPRSTGDRLRLAETVRGLYSELAAEGRDFVSLKKAGGPSDIESEIARWDVLALAQRHYRELLGASGHVDPHEARLAAIRDGRIQRDRRIVLVGVADMNHILAHLVESMLERVSVLVVAPQSEADSFDGLGRLRTDAWVAREVPLELERWRVAEKPVDQADTVSAVLGEHQGAYAASEVVIGVADEEVVPYLERRLQAAGARTVNAAGSPILRTRPLRLLQALARHLGRGGFGEFAALVRDTDLGPLLSREEVAGLADIYHVEHLPRSGQGPWVEDPKCTPALRSALARLEKMLGPLGKSEPHTLAKWTVAMRDFLLAVYSKPLDESVESERVLAAALSILGKALGELEEVPASLTGSDATDELGAVEAIELLLRQVRGEPIPPAPPQAGEPAVELLGWLELPLDDTPALVVTGFNEGNVPASIGGHAFLPDGARRRLGLPSDADRLARDVYAATLILESGREVTFVTGRRNALGDPLVPSRLAFHRPEQDIPSRVLRYLPRNEEERPLARASIEETEDQRDFACPTLETTPEVTAMSVSSFALYLRSPYNFYIERVLKLKTGDDRVRELDPMRFGNLTHEVLEELAAEGVCQLQDADAITDALLGRLARSVEDRFGADPLPAVALQLQQIEWRMRKFAEKEAERRAAGWRIHAVEWSPEPDGELEVDGKIMRITGRIDRIDVHEDAKHWAIYDYKTGEDIKDPVKNHKGQKRWKDLQLPLYRHLTRDIGLTGELELGYAKVGKDPSQMGFVPGEWTPAHFDEAMDEARRIVREVRAGKFDDSGRKPFDEIMRALWGEGMVTVTDQDGHVNAEVLA